MKLEEFLVREEGDDSRHLPDGRVASTWDSLGHVWNIGPGITKGVTKDTVWTQEQLKAAEEKEFAETRAAVARLVTVPLGENQRTAVESLVYNIGIAGFARSTVLRCINSKNFSAVPAAFRMWNKAGGSVCRGLVNRREHEILLWLHPDSVPPPSTLKTPVKVPVADEPVNTGTETMLQALISILGPAILGQMTGQAQTPPPVSQSTGTGVTISKTSTLMNFIVSIIGGVLAAKGFSDVGADSLHLIAGVGGVITCFAGLISHLHLTNGSNGNTLNTIGTLLTQIGNTQIAQQSPLAAPSPQVSASLQNSTPAS